ncbi:uncharacterized protein G2W53_041168 [Senna tora]|uniref:Uncharacterized protein n=1 Tax=Senna tora TaxID=362788 RepID=A0A834VYH7_9FABA|nr:uncharacterized protein G2W53_041168 [Senna tora]
MVPLIGAQLSIAQEKEVHNDPKSFANHPNKPMPITINASTLSVVLYTPAKTPSFTLNIPCLPSSLKYQKAIEDLIILTPPSTCFPQPTLCITIYPSKPHHIRPIEL